MGKDFFKGLEKINEINLAIVITIVIAILVTIVLIMAIQEERFSSVYLDPESYTNYPDSNEISFIYGIKSFEKEQIRYQIGYFINNTLVDTKEVQLNPGETFEEGKVLSLPSIPFPAQVRIVVTTPYDTYEVHHWLKKPE